MTSVLGQFWRWWRSPDDWTFGLFLAFILVGAIVAWRLYVYGGNPRAVQRRSAGLFDIILGIALLLFGLIEGALSPAGTNGAMLLNIVSFIGAVLLAIGVIVRLWPVVRPAAAL